MSDQDSSIIERDILRNALIRIGNISGGQFADDVSSEFLSQVADEMLLFTGKLSAQLDESGHILSNWREKAQKARLKLIEETAKLQNMAIECGEAKGLLQREREDNEALRSRLERAEAIIESYNAMKAAEVPIR